MSSSAAWSAAGRRKVPTWATFDEDKEPPRRAPTPAAGASRPKPGGGASRPEPARSTPAEPATEPSSRPEPEASSLPDPDTTAMEAAAHVDDSVVELATHAAAGAATADNGPAVPTDVGSAPVPADGNGAGDQAAPRAAEESAETDGPAVLPGYDGMTLAQVRGHLRELSAADVATLLDYEQSGDNRAPFLTLLSNRLATLRRPGVVTRPARPDPPALPGCGPAIRRGRTRGRSGRWPSG